MSNKNNLLAIFCLLFIGTSGLYAQNMSVDGRVGIGINNSNDWRLRVDQTTTNVAQFMSQSNIASIVEVGAYGTGGKAWGLVSTANLAGEGAGKFLLRNFTDGNVAFAVTSIGNIGMGTTSPVAKLQIVDGTDVSLGSGGYLITGDLSSMNLGLDDNEVQARNNGNPANLFIQNEGGNTVMNSTGGNVGIGLGAVVPSKLLDVGGDIQLRGSQLKFFTGGVDTKNIFIGDVAGDNVTAGCCSTVTGVQAGGAITAANSATLYGNSAGKVLSTGVNNTMVGLRAGLATTMGGENTFIGTFAGELNETGNFNTALGFDSGPSSATLSSSASVGAFAASNASNKMQLGSSSTTLSTSGGYTIVSDGRFKKDLKNDIEGLDFIMNLKPVSYRFDYSQYDNFLRGAKGSADLPTEYKQQLQEKSQQREVGFIAQEVAKASDDRGIPFNGVYRPQNDQDNYALDYGRLTVPLVKATQEQQAAIEALTAENEELKARLAKIEALLQSGTVDHRLSTSSLVLTDAKLEQNQPNPFNGSTTVRYFIPQDVKRAELRITDLTGKGIKSLAILVRGKGQTTFDAHTLSNGTYQYSLFLDGQLLETKQMVLTKN